MSLEEGDSLGSSHADGTCHSLLYHLHVAGGNLLDQESYIVHRVPFRDLRSFGAWHTVKRLFIATNRQCG